MEYLDREVHTVGKLRTMALVVLSRSRLLDGLLILLVQRSIRSGRVRGFFGHLVEDVGGSGLFCWVLRHGCVLGRDSI